MTENRPRGTAVFLDTSIQIARFFHGKAQKALIQERLKRYDIALTSSVVRTEFRRRALKEAAYILRVLKKKGSFGETRRHVEEKLTHPGSRRKQLICLAMLSTVFDQDDDNAWTERLRRTMRTLLEHGPYQFEDSVGHVVPGIRCYCGRQPIVEKTPYEHYEFGSDNCSESRGQCSIVPFLKENSPLVDRLLLHMKSLPSAERTPEIIKSEEFLRKIKESPESAPGEEPCKTVGDLLIAMESQQIPEFYTLNRAESKVLCAVLKQRLIVRPQNDDKEDEVYDYSGLGDATSVPSA